ncbi:MAG: pilus assembly protein PilM [Phycisphaeraceae bacterium]|nr:pilus assembly protein PilM [Phycisphaeraceae bacterium]
MKIKVKKALGIEISSTSISLALLKQDRRGLHLLRAVRRPMPDGLLKDGMIQDEKLLRKIIRDFKSKCSPTRLTTLSLFSSRSLIQMMEIPADVTLNMGQYVHKEIKHYVNLAGLKTVSDYRSVESTEASKTVFVAAGDSRCVSSSVNACQAVGLDVQVVEPSLLAYARALYHKKVANQFGCNVVFAIIREDQVCFAVWRDRGLRFIRTHSLADIKDEAENVGAFLAQKIMMIMQYYDVEVSERCDLWEINVVTDDASSFPEQAKTRLCEAVGKVSVDVITSENFEAHGSVNISPRVSQEQISIAAVGHAMRALSNESSLPEINLLPTQIRQEKEVRFGMLITAIAMAAILLIMGLATMGLMVKINEICARIATKKPQSVVGEVVQERGQIESQIEQVGRISTMLTENLASQKNVNWSGVLSDIKNNRPKGVCLTSLDTRNENEVSIQGQALTYSDVTGYVTRLGQTAHIESAKLIKTDRKGGRQSHHVYEIKCQLKMTMGI